MKYDHDIAMHKPAEEVGRPWYSFHQSVFDSLTEPVLVIAANYRIKAMNRAARRFFLADSAIAELSFCYTICHDRGTPCSGDQHPCPMEQVKRSGQPVTVVHEHRRLTGEKRFLEIVASPLPGPDGVFEGIIASFRDITERARREREVEALYKGASQKLKRLTALSAIDIAGRASLDLRASLEAFLDQVISGLSVDAADVMLFNEDTQTLEYYAGRGFCATESQRAPLRMGSGHAGLAALERRIVNFFDLRKEANALWSDKNLEGFFSYAAVPIIANGNVRGVLEIFLRRPLQPDPEWINLLEALSFRASVLIENAGLLDTLRRSNTELGVAYDAALEEWAKTVEIRDRSTKGHSQRVARMTALMCSDMGISGSELVNVYRGALLHDIGMLSVPEGILLKKGRLNDEEWEIIRRHPEEGRTLLSRVPDLLPACDIPYFHHEKWNGTGYPNKLKGEDIPLAARIFSVVDVWDSLCSRRPYRAAWAEDKALEHIRSLASIDFDPDVVKLFLEKKL
jgi:HD-GYP domain-containing protein (c-di-GMP phosphodiesterase class II)